MKIKHYFIWIFSIFLLSTAACHADTFDVKGNMLRFKGEINNKSAAQITAFLDAGGKTIIVSSPGGSVEAGQAIGMAMADKEVTLIVDSYCLSSCANYLFLAAANKVLRPSAILGFHGGIGIHTPSNLGAEASSERLTASLAPLLKLIENEQKFYEKIKVNPDLVDLSAKLARGEKSFIVINIEGKQNIKKIFPADHEAEQEKFIEKELKRNPRANWSLTFQNETQNKLYFPSIETLNKFGVTGVLSYPYPRNQHELEVRVKNIFDDVIAVGDF